MTLETKNQWARDDPAFAVIQAVFVAVTLYHVLLPVLVTDFMPYIRSAHLLSPLLSDILVFGDIYGQLYIHYLSIGLRLELSSHQHVGKVLTTLQITSCLILPFNSYLANKYMKQYSPHSVEQEVEWLFAFDVHCNSFFCSFLVTYVLQVHFYPSPHNKIRLLVTLFLCFSIFCSLSWYHERSCRVSSRIHSMRQRRFGMHI